jgi:uncharacterized protein (TIRG00374 family)
MAPTKRNRVLSAAKILIGAGLLLALLVWEDNARRLVDLVRDLRLEYLLPLIGIALLLRVVSALKWGVLLRDVGVRLSFVRLLNLYLIGQFFSNFTPSMIGGDVTKIYLLGRQIRSHSRSAASVFLDRFTGLVSLFGLVLVFTMVNPALIRDPLIGLSVAVAALGCAGLAFLLAFAPRLAGLARRLEPIPLAGKGLGLLRVFYEALCEYRGRYRTFAVAFGYSVAFYFLVSLSMYVSCLAVGLGPSFLDVALVTPIIFLVMTVPVSPGNIGWWEWAVSLLLGGAGASMPEGLMVALVMRAVSTGVSMLGGVLFLFEKVDLPAEGGP